MRPGLRWRHGHEVDTRTRSPAPADLGSASAALSWLQALVLVASVTGVVALTAAVMATRTYPDRYPEMGTGLWWVVTTVGYGNVVPASTGGRLVGFRRP